jgi:hypothetical protein
MTEIYLNGRLVTGLLQTKGVEHDSRISKKELPIYQRVIKHLASKGVISKEQEKMFLAYLAGQQSEKCQQATSQWQVALHLREVLVSYLEGVDLDGKLTAEQRSALSLATELTLRIKGAKLALKPDAPARTATEAGARLQVSADQRELALEEHANTDYQKGCQPKVNELTFSEDEAETEPGIPTAPVIERYRSFSPDYREEPERLRLGGEMTSLELDPRHR